MLSLGKFFIQLGKSLMLPIAVLPIAGILLRLGQGDVLDINSIAAAGAAVFDNLPVIFALGVAIGFANDNHGAVALAAFVGHVIFINALKTILPDANMGVLSGILIGIIAGVLYNRFKGVNFPNYVAFFGGRRFIPIITGASALILAFIMALIWPPIAHVINMFGNWIITSGNIGLFSYGVANRLLIPLGLHHVLNTLIWFQFGDYTVVENGMNVIKHGDLWRFFAGDKTAGSFMAGFFPVMMFGLVGASLAIIIAAKPSARKITAGIFISSALTAFLTGITEPLEFSFMFVAFPLYVIHALLTGLSMVIMNILGVKLGFTFSAGLFDYILSYGIGTKGWLLLPVGLIYFVAYFLIFYGMIKVFNFNTPGREEEDLSSTNREIKAKPKAKLQNIKRANTQEVEYTIAEKYLLALGGADNILNFGNCTTRLRLEVKDNEIINELELKQLGAKGVFNKIKGSVQVIIGPQVEALAEDMKKLL